MMPTVSRIPAIIFALMFIFKFQSRKIGDILKIKSTMATMTELAMEKFLTNWAGKQAPFKPENCNQKYSTGWH